MLKTADQVLEFSSKIGGTRVIYEGNINLLVGGFNFDITELPTYPNVLPAGTPIFVDEEARTIKIHYAFKVLGSTKNSKTARIAKSIEGSRLKPGMMLGVASDDLATQYDAAIVVESIVTNNEEYDVVTFSTAQTFADGAILWEVKPSGEKFAIKCIPNALTDRDKRLAPAAKAMNGDAVWGSDRPILERRIPPVAPAIKKALKDADCYFRWSVRK